MANPVIGNGKKQSERIHHVRPSGEEKKQILNFLAEFKAKFSQSSTYQNSPEGKISLRENVKIWKIISFLFLTFPTNWENDAFGNLFFEFKLVSSRIHYLLKENWGAKYLSLEEYGINPEELSRGKWGISEMKAPITGISSRKKYCSIRKGLSSPYFISSKLKIIKNCGRNTALIPYKWV